MSEFLDPPMKELKRGGRRGVDWETFRKMWEKQSEYNSVNAFLAIHQIDPQTARSRAMTKDWPKKAVVVKNEAYETDVRRVWSMIRAWRAQMAENDVNTGNKIRALIEKKIEMIWDSLDRGYEEIVDKETGDVKRVRYILKPNELASLARTLEQVQRIQRLALGMSTDNIGIEEAKRLAEEKSELIDDTPTFTVSLNKDGKFESIKPRRIK